MYNNFRGTIFVPTDTAFTAYLRAMNMQAFQLFSNPPALVKILQCHMTSTLLQLSPGWHDCGTQRRALKKPNYHRPVGLAVN
jgi:uncharacterized surface protein with fasciclin (FAS1) repeats